MTNQPKWKYITNLGDIGFVDYGGFFVFIDETGVYEAEAEVLVVDDYQIDESLRWTVSRFILERCTYEDDVLSNNPFHKDHPVWFADNIKGIASSMDWNPKLLIEALCSEDVVERARAYQSVMEYYGPFEFDQYPIKYTSRDEVEARYADCLV